MAIFGANKKSKVARVQEEGSPRQKTRTSTAAAATITANNGKNVADTTLTATTANKRTSRDNNNNNNPSLREVAMKKRPQPVANELKRSNSKNTKKKTYVLSSKQVAKNKKKIQKSSDVAVITESKPQLELKKIHVAYDPRSSSTTTTTINDSWVFVTDLGLNAASLASQNIFSRIFGSSRK
jgi:hypothetical protein